MDALPTPISALADRLAAMPGPSRSCSAARAPRRPATRRATGTWACTTAARSTPPRSRSWGRFTRLAGGLERRTEFPEALARAGAERWRFHAEFTLQHAAMRADRGDVAGAAGQAAKAAIERAHELLCASRTWVLNEKRILERAGLGHVHGPFGAIPQDPTGLRAWVQRVRAALGGG